MDTKLQTPPENWKGGIRPEPALQETRNSLKRLELGKRW
jgi:hypothetical protein